MGFKVKYFAEMRSQYKAVLWRTEIEERGYEGTAEEMTFNGSNPLSITWERRGDNFTVPVKGSEATITILCHQNFHYINLFTSDPRHFRLSVYRNTKLYWRGYVVSDLYSESFTAPPYEVNIKAIDGFSLLSSIPYATADETPHTGRKSLWEIIAECIDLLELDLNVADWMDLYAEGMDYNESPIRQVYVDMEQLYKAYGTPTYRDVLELCLKPFGAQIFQSNGSLHIRRTKSLYSDTRPLSFYEVGSEFPLGWLITASGQTLLTTTHEPILTDNTRERVDSMWDGEINVQGSGSTLEIVPALQEVSVAVQNRLYPNILVPMGAFTAENWTAPEDVHIDTENENTLAFRGNDTTQGSTIELSYPVEQSSLAMTMRYTLDMYRYIATAAGSSRPPTGTEFSVEYGFKLVGENSTLWLNEDGAWVTTETTHPKTMVYGTEESVELEISGFPINGNFVIFYHQTLGGHSTTSRTYYDYLYFKDFILSMDTEEEYKDVIEYQSAINPANNVQMAIELPIGDLPYIPNDKLLYSFYFTNSSGNPTRMWHTKDSGDINTLTEHLISTAQLFYQRPAKRITAEMFTAKHLDMNTIVKDDKFLNTGFYINSIELDTLGDTYNSELIEMPGLLDTDTAPSGDDCIEVCELSSPIKTAVKCANRIVMLLDDHTLVMFNSQNRTIETLNKYNYSVALYPAHNAFVVVGDSTYTAYDYQGKQLQQVTNEYIAPAATYIDKKIIAIKGMYGEFVITEAENYWPIYNRPDDPVQSITPPINYSLVGEYTIVLGSDNTSFSYDYRTSPNYLFDQCAEDMHIQSISDYFVCCNEVDDTSKMRPPLFKVYQRTTLQEKTLIKTFTEHAEFVDHTLSDVAFSQYSTIKLWNRATDSTTIIKNTEGSHQQLLSLMFVDGELYIIRENKIFKYTR